ncbi:unnamed protein product [Owenia fusiformis]|uniref:Uncharacterized protein n=1 Tax=Owenia fusiformis TaxID=6347 RepID=A0A8J1Y1K9_OWEFU|nr:unnamed protein product [Owenia fusiformis]
MADLKAEVEANNSKFMTAFNAKNFEDLGNLYTEDCVLMPPGGATVTGREATAAVFKAASDAGVATVTLEVDDVIGQGNDVVSERSRFTMKTAEGAIADEGKFIVVWKRINGQLYLHWDCFNSNKK